MGEIKQIGVVVRELFSKIEANMRNASETHSERTTDAMQITESEKGAEE